MSLYYQRQAAPASGGFVSVPAAARARRAAVSPQVPRAGALRAGRLPVGDDVAEPRQQLAELGITVRDLRRARPVRSRVRRRSADDLRATRTT